MTQSCVHITQVTQARGNVYAYRSDCSR